MPEISRREFITTTAIAGIAPSLVKRQTKYELSIYFTGLMLFHKDGTTSMEVGLLDHAHETIVVAKAGDFDATNTVSASATQVSSWRADQILSSGMEYLQGSPLAIDLTVPTGALSSNSLNVFPLKSMATSGATLKSDWKAKCQSSFSFKNGNFKGITLYGHADKCRHENQVWTQFDGSTAGAVIGTILSVVKYDVEVEGAEFKIGNGSLKLKQSAPIYVLQVPKSAVVKPDRRLAKDCEHYYTLLDGHTPPNWYPRRPVISKACQPLVNLDPVYCPPAEF